MITVLGASGFIGSQLVSRLASDGVDCQAIGRNDVVPKGNLGHVIYCVGVTADFRSRLLDTVEAHVCCLHDLVSNHKFESLLYLSSTRVYAGAETAGEEQPLRVGPQNADDVYNISKAMGESLTLNCGHNTRVARVSNVYGPDFASQNFLASVLKEAVVERKVVLLTARDSAKDYISVTDVVNGVLQIATRGRERIYNLASGTNVSHQELADRLRPLARCEIEFAPDAQTVRFPQINIERMRNEFDFAPASILDDLASLVGLYERNRDALK